MQEHERLIETHTIQQHQIHYPNQLKIKNYKFNKHMKETLKTPKLKSQKIALLVNKKFLSMPY